MGINGNWLDIRRPGNPALELSEGSELVPKVMLKSCNFPIDSCKFFAVKDMVLKS